MQALRSILAMCMPAVYALAGIALLFTTLLNGSIVRWRQPMGALLLGYGLLRAYIWWTKRRASRTHP